MNGVNGVSSVRWEQDAEGVVTLVLDAPGSSVNTMDSAYVRSMGEVVDRLEAQRAGVRGVILTSAKRTFFAGGDIDELGRAAQADPRALAERIETVKSQLRRLETLGVPVVAAVGGSAMGGGLEIALACHHRVVLDAPHVRLGLPEVTLGLLPGAGGVVRTVRMLGLTAALTSLLLQGQRLRPQQALELGLVDELATDVDDLMARARAFVGSRTESRQPWDVKGYGIPGGTPSSPSLAPVLATLTPLLSRQLKGARYPAPHAILAAAVEGLSVDVDTALTIEGRYFLSLLRDRSSSSIISAVWTDKNSVDRGPAAGSAAPSSARPAWKPSRVGVVGAGMMGAGIAESFARSGADVVLADVSLEAAERGRSTASVVLDDEVAKGRRSAEQRDAVLARITPTASLGDLSGCDLVVEAVFEDEALKHGVLTELAGLLSPDGLLTSNTSTLPIGGLASVLPAPDRFLGMHFFSPVHRMPLVELIQGAATSEESLARARDAVRMLGKTPIVVSDSRGFFTSRVFGTYLLEGVALLVEGMAPMSVERAALLAGFPVGPLSVHDEVTLGLTVRIADQARAASAAAGSELPAEHPAMPLVRLMVDRGRLGKATGGGFFDWTPTKRVWPGLAELAPSRPDAVSLREAQERLLGIMAIETARCLEEGVLHGVADANVGSLLGIGFPALYGGALGYVDQHEGGVAGFVRRAEELADAHGDRFRAPDVLRLRAVEAGSVRAAAGLGTSAA